MILASSTSSDVLAAVGSVIAALSVAIAGGGVAAALKRGFVRTLRIGSFEVELPDPSTATDAEMAAAVADLRAQMRGRVAAAGTARGDVNEGASRAPDGLTTGGGGSPPTQSEETRAGADGGSRIAPPEESQEAGGGAVKKLETELGSSEDLLTAYHALGLAQSRVMFWFSVIFASLGFALIALTVVVTVTSAHPTIESGNLVSLISGAIVEAVSALFFIQSNRARALMSAFFDRLRSDKSLDRALELADDVPDELIRSRLKAILAFSLAGASPSDKAIGIVLGADEIRAPIQALSPARGDATGSSGGARSGRP
jgi:hypothetical protein